MGITSQTFSTSCLILGLLVSLASVTPLTEARAFFVFGDSIGDNGNNNYLNTTIRADAPPYGIDYPTHRATGRFSNGLIIPDLISEAIGSEPTLPYLSPELTGKKLLIGATFASAGVGILDSTGVQFSNIIRMTKQLEYFQQYQKRVSALIGPEETRKLVNEGLVLLTLGANDFIYNYFLDPFSGRSRRNTLSGFVDYLIFMYRKMLLRLYGLGARRVLVMGIGPLGCVPAELAKRSKTGHCVEELQEAADLFNSEIVGLVNHLNKDIASYVFIAASIYETMDFIGNPGAYGFVTSKIACCGQGPYNGVGLCTVASNLCQYREDNAFWDSFHLTQKANRIIFAHLRIGSTKYMNPMNLSTIMALDARP